jgi:light-harvesting complex 1 beta chain
MAADNTRGSLSGLTEQQAKEFHAAMMSGTLGFVAACLVAHVLVWFWRPWF